MKPVAQLDEDFARIIPVETAECLAIVEVHAAVGHIQGIQRSGESLTEVLTDREIESCVLRQVVPWIWLPWKGIAEARAVVDVSGSKRPPGKADVPANVEGVALVVIEGTQAGIWIAEICGEIRKPTANGAPTFGDLIGIGKMDLSAVSDARRAQGQFPTADFCSLNRDG